MAGPVLAALSGAAVGAAVGGIAGGLIGMGIPELEAKRFEGKINGGNILISVHAENSAEVEQAKEIFKEGLAQDICSTSEAGLKDSTAGARTERPTSSSISSNP